MNKMSNGTECNNYGKSKKLPQYIAALSVCMGAVAAGTVLGWTANISSKLKSGELNDIPIDDDVLGWIGSCMTLGAMCVCFPIIYVCDLIGRKYAMLLTIIPFTIGWLLIIFADSVAMIYIGRFLNGVAGGAFSVAAPIYTSEIAEKDVRGALGSYFQLLLTVGILFAYVLGSCLEIKVYIIVCALVPLVFGLVFILQPETPVYSLKKDNREAAAKALKKLRGADFNVDAEIVDIQQQIEKDRTMNISLAESFKKRETKKSILISFGLMFFQQFSGINAIIFYTDTIFKAAGSSIAPTDSTIIVGVMQVVATFISSLIIDKFGRKLLLLASASLMAISSFLLAVYFTLKDRGVLDAATVESISFLPILAMCSFIVVFSLGFGPIPWMISAEILPPEIKSVICSAAGTFNWLLAFIVTKFYSNLKDGIGGDSTFYLFGCVMVVSTFFVYFVCIEPKGKTLDEIQRELKGEKVSPDLDHNKVFTSL